jgi:signal transduction histidine kinase
MLLVEGGKRLARCLTVIDTIEMLAALVVPALADWSYVVHCDVSGGPMLITSAHSDVAKLPLLRRLHGCRPDFAAPEGAPRVFRTGEVALYQDITDEQLGVGDSRGWPIVGTRDPSTLQILRELGMKSLLCVPIRGRTGVDAVLMLASATNPRRYDPDDIAMATDLADRAAISLENGRLLLEAREALRARDEFIAVAAHELRTPLTSLMLQLQLLGHAIERDEISRDVLRHGVATAEEHGRVLTTLADRLLEATSLPTYALRVTVEKVELRSLLDEVVARLGRQLERARCTLSMSVPPGIVGQWDRARLAQVFDALLSNALKFGAGRPIEIAATLADDSVAVSVCDHGVGIAREDQARIFERFERAAPMRHFGGLGLGLYMAAKIVSSLGGSIRVESEPGKGACFIVQLPLAAPDRRANSDVMFPSRAGAT